MRNFLTSFLAHRRVIRRLNQTGVSINDTNAIYTKISRSRCNPMDVRWY